MMNYPKYESYKDSGIDWLGEIPSDWDVNRFKFLCNISTGGKNTEDKVTNGLYSFYVRSQTPERINTYSFDGEAILTAGDGAGVGKVYHYVNEKFDIHQRVYKFCFFKKVKGKLLYYYLVANFYNVAILGTAKSTVDSLRLPLIQNFPIAYPLSIVQQEIIIKFLDQKTSQIDEAIRIKEKQIELLKEQKQIMIQNAVTKGLDPNVKMKDSGVDWIGEIPEHWEVAPLKRYATLSPSIVVKNKNSDELVSFLPMEKVSVDGEIEGDLLLPIKAVSSGFTVFSHKDVIVAKITPCFENGKSAYLDNLPTMFGYGSTEFYVLRASKVLLGGFLYLVVKSPLFLKAGEGFMIGSAGQKRVPSSFVHNFPIALPMLDEQEKIIEAVRSYSEKIADIIKVETTQIEKLKEYKTTLINSAVTGKIKVTPEMVGEA